MSEELTPQEKAELATLKEEFGETPLNKAEQEELATLKTELEPSTMDAFLEGGSQGLTMRLGDNVASVAEAASNTFLENKMKGNEDYLSTAVEEYHKTQEQREVIRQRAIKDHPVAYYAGDIAGTIASTAATFGIGGFIRGGVALGTLSGRLSTNAAIGFVHGIGDAESDTIAGVINEGLESAILGGAGEVIAPVAGMAKAAMVPPLRKVQANAFVKFLGDNGNYVMDSLKGKGKKVVDWAERMVKYTDETGEAIVTRNISRLDLRDKFNHLKKFHGDNMGKVLDSVDKDLGLRLNAKGIYNHLDEVAMKELKDTAIEDNIGVLKKLQKRTLYALGLDSKKVSLGKNLVIDEVDKIADPSLAKLHEYQSFLYNTSQDLWDTGQKIPRQQSRIYKAMAKEISKTVDEALEFSSEFSQYPLKGIYDKSRLVYGDLSEGVTALTHRLAQDNGKTWVQRLFNDKLFSVYSTAGIMTSAMGMPGAQYALGVAGLRAIQTAKPVNGFLIKAAKNIADAAEANPDKYATMLGHIVSSAAISGEALMDSIEQANAQVELAETPLQRNSQEVIRRKDSILTLLHNKNKEAASLLRKAIEDQNTDRIGAVMKDVAVLAPDLIEPGLGWDGIAYTDQDKTSVFEWINKIKNTRKRMHLKSNFAKDFKIPEELSAGTSGQTPDKFFQFQKARKGPSNNTI